MKNCDICAITDTITESVSVCDVCNLNVCDDCHFTNNEADGAPSSVGLLDHFRIDMEKLNVKFLVN